MPVPLPRFFRYFTARLAISCLLVSISVFNYGMDVTAFSTTQATEPFIRRFGAFNGTKYVISPASLSILNSVPRITFALGIILGGLIGERFGRRSVMALMLVICLVGVIISYTATNFAQVLAGRMIVNMYIGMEGWLVPMFQAEIVPAQIRGVVVNSYVFNHIFGGFIMSCVTYRTSKITTDMCWKIPVAVMFIIPSIVLLLVWMVPESPRWLVRKGRDEEALKWLKYIYGETPEYARLAYHRYWVHRDIIHEAYGHYGGRDQRYKLIYWYNEDFKLEGTRPGGQPKEWELFDCDEDPLELFNCYHDTKYADVVRRMTKLLEDKMAEIGDEPLHRPLIASNPSKSIS